MAEGLVRQPIEEAEDNGREIVDEYFRDPFFSSFFQNSSCNDELSVMHDLINNLVQFVLDLTRQLFTMVLHAIQFCYCCRFQH